MKTKTFLYLSLLFGSFGILSKLVYRPFIINTPIDDFGIQGFLPNLFAALSLCLFVSFWNTKNHIRSMMFVTLGILTYEMEQIWTDRVFNYLDVAATIVGLGLSVLIFKYFSRNKEKI